MFVETLYFNNTESRAPQRDVHLDVHLYGVRGQVHAVCLQIQELFHSRYLCGKGRFAQCVCSNTGGVPKCVCLRESMFAVSTRSLSQDHNHNTGHNLL